MGCDKTLTEEDLDRIVPHHHDECFGPFFGFQAPGPKRLPDLVIHHPHHTPPDHLDIDDKRDELYIFRPGIKAPIGVTFEHSLRNGKRYSDHGSTLDGFLMKRFSTDQVVRAKDAILAGRLHQFHFIADATLRTSPTEPSFPDVIRLAIEKANAELIAHSMRSHAEFSDAQLRQVESAIAAGRMQEFLFVANATLPAEKFTDFPESLRLAIEKANAALLVTGKSEHLISYHSTNYRQTIPLKVWTPPERRGPPKQSVHYPRRNPGVDPQTGH